MAQRTNTRTGGKDATSAQIAGRFAIAVGDPPMPTPEGWSWVRLAEVAEMESGHTPSRKEPSYWNGEIPWLSVSEATGCHGQVIEDTTEHVTQAGIDNSSARVLPAGTVCVSRTASLGFVVGLARPMATSQGFANWVCSDAVNWRYLLYLFMAEKDSMHLFAAGSAHQTIYYPELKALSVCLPPRHEQDAIVEVLAALDDKIASNRRVATSAQALAEAVFRACFVDFDFVGSRGMVSGEVEGLGALRELFPDDFDDSRLGRIPAGWSVGRFADIVDLVRSTKKAGPSTAVQPYVPIDCISARRLGLERWLDGSEAKSSLIAFDRDDILFGSMRAYFHKVAIAPFDGITRTTCFVLRPKSRASWAYTVLLASQASTVDFASRTSVGTTIPYAKWEGALADMPVVVPPQRVAEGFGELVGPLLEMARDLPQENAALAAIRDALLVPLISGTLRLDPAGVAPDHG